MAKVSTEVNYKNNDFAKVFLDRHSVRQFDPKKTIARDEIKDILDEATRTPSACNLQAWKYVVCDTEESREKLHDVILPFNYTHFDSAPVTIFILGDTEAYKVYRKEWTAVYERGDITKEYLDQIFSQFLPMYENASREFLEKDATVDCAMLAMSLLLCARAHGYEAVPWAGYKQESIVNALGQDEKRFIPVMAISLGYPDTTASDENTFDSQRYETEKFTEFLGE